MIWCDAVFCREAVKTELCLGLPAWQKCLASVLEYVPKDPLHPSGVYSLVYLLYWYFYFSIKYTNSKMGLFSNYSSQQELHPVNPPVGIYSNFTAKQPTMLTLREHAFSFSGVCYLLPTSFNTAVCPE